MAKERLARASRVYWRTWFNVVCCVHAKRAAQGGVRDMAQSAFSERDRYVARARFFPAVQAAAAHTQPRAFLPLSDGNGHAPLKDAWDTRRGWRRWNGLVTAAVHVQSDLQRGLGTQRRSASTRFLSSCTTPRRKVAFVSEASLVRQGCASAFAPSPWRQAQLRAA